LIYFPASRRENSAEGFLSLRFVVIHFILTLPSQNPIFNTCIEEGDPECCMTLSPFRPVIEASGGVWTVPIFTPTSPRKSFPSCWTSTRNPWTSGRIPLPNRDWLK